MWWLNWTNFSVLPLFRKLSFEFSKIRAVACGEGMQRQSGADRQHDHAQQEVVQFVGRADERRCLLNDLLDCQRVKPAQVLHAIHGKNARRRNRACPPFLGFAAIKEWNKADVYARTIALFGQRLEGKPAQAAEEPAPFVDDRVAGLTDFQAVMDLAGELVRLSPQRMPVAQVAELA